MDARVTFTDEFKNNTVKPIGRKERAELRWKKLVESEENGELQKKKTFNQEPQATDQDHANNHADNSVYTVKVAYSWGELNIESADKGGIVEIIKALRQ